MKTVYARFVGRAHPSIRGYHVEHALRALADDQRNPSDIAGLARHALQHGPGNLPILADALEERGHPMAASYNWRAVPRGIQIDQAVRTAAQAMADREADRLEDDYGIRYANQFAPSAERYINVVRLTHPYYSRNMTSAEQQEFLREWERDRDRLHMIAKTAVPDMTRDELLESAERLDENFYNRQHSAGYPMLGRHRGAAAVGRIEGRPSHPDAVAHRFHQTQVRLQRRSVKVRYASFPGTDQPTVTVRVPVPTPAPMAKGKPRQQPLAKFGNTVAPAPQSVQPAAPGAVPQQPRDQDFAPVAFAGPRAIIFPHSPQPKGRPVQPRAVKMAREDMQSFLDHMRQNPDDHLSNAVFADWLRENGHHAAGFVLQKAFEKPGNNRGTRLHPVTGREVNWYHAMLPGHQGGPPFVIGMSPAREPTPDGQVIAGIGLPTIHTPHFDPSSKDYEANNAYFRTLTMRFARMSHEEARHLADLIRSDGQVPYLFRQVGRQKADPHRWLTMLGVPMPKRRRRPKTFSRPTPQRV